MIALQEELDWECYRLYGLIEEDAHNTEPPPLKLGQRAFEIVLARKMAAGEMQTTWFERHGSTPITELPADWPDDYRQLVERRIALIESDPNIRAHRATRIQTPLEHRAVGIAASTCPRELAPRPSRILLRLRRPHE